MNSCAAFLLRKNHEHSASSQKKQALKMNLLTCVFSTQKLLMAVDNGY